MDCEDAVKFIYGSLDEPLSPGDEKKLAEHLRECEKCRRELGQLKRVDDVLRSAPVPAVPRARLADTVGSVSQIIRDRSRRRSAGRRGLWLWAAAAAAIVVAGGAWFLIGRAPVAAERRGTPREGALQARQAPSPEPPGLLDEDQGPAAEPALDVPRIDAAAADRVGQPTEPGTLLVERLVQAELVLSETEAPGRKAVIFCAMSRHVLTALRDSLARDEAEQAQAFGRGYARLVRDGILPNVRLTSVDEERGSVSQVADSLEGNCRMLNSLLEKLEGRERILLAEVLTVSKACLSAAEGVLRAY